jgi:membrane protein YqaA with SNARE-associated domain
VLTTGYIGLALSSFLSATILPFASEGVLILMLQTGFDPVGCLITASLSNTVGSFVTYYIGRLGAPKWAQRFKMKPERLEKVQFFIQRYGFWAGLIAWVPIIGDTVTLALGFFRVSFIPTALAIATGKTLRYALIIALMQ